MIEPWSAALCAGAAWTLGRRGHRRLQLSRAKHPSLRGHARIASWVARQVPYYAHDEDRFFGCDGAPDEVAEARRDAFDRLGERLGRAAPRTISGTRSLSSRISDVAFTDRYRVPFPFREVVSSRLPIGNLVSESDDTRLRDLDGNWSYDLGGSYGVNLFGYDFYKSCLAEGFRRAQELGPVLGPYHPVIADNVERLREISGLDEVSFHMSGTEAVMQAVRLARYHTGRSHVVRFCGSYHGWWDGVQPGVGNPRPVGDVYTLKEMDEATLTVLRTRRDIACVLVNPLQALHPNAAAPSDVALVASDRAADYDRERYAAWLRELRAVCTSRSIALIFDEVFLGFRLGYGGAQEYFGVRADLVTYGKTLGGGLPVGVVCGRRDLMRRYREGRPADICFARGTFNSHPYVMATMNEFLVRVGRDEVRAELAAAEKVWNDRAARLNERLAERGLPVRVANLSSVWTTLYQVPSRYNWMLQFYLRANGLALSWIGTARFIFSNAYTDADFAQVADRFVTAASEMQADGWWWQGEGLTSRTIKRSLLRELLRARFRPGPKATPATERSLNTPRPAALPSGRAVHP